MEECPFCQKMRRHVFTQKPIIDYFKQHFLNFEVILTFTKAAMDN
jgi:thioredoxin-related protein